VHRHAGTWIQTQWAVFGDIHCDVNEDMSVS
jgi:hypothetical protein